VSDAWTRGLKVSQPRRILVGIHKHHRSLTFGVEGTGTGIKWERPVGGRRDALEPKGGGGWGMGPLARGAFPRFSRSLRLGYG